MIQLAYPWALLSLLSIPVILVLHSLRPARRTVVVSATSLWHEALRDRQRGLGLQKLLRNLSLLLLMLFALVVSLGLAGPRWLAQSAAGDDSVLVLDVSASMKTRAGAPNESRVWRDSTVQEQSRASAVSSAMVSSVSCSAENRSSPIVTSGRSSPTWSRARIGALALAREATRRARRKTVS